MLPCLSLIKFDRRDGDSLKWGRYKNSDVIAAWVADMDFPSAPMVVDALNSASSSSPCWVTRPADSVFDAIQGYLSSYHQWEVKAIIFLPGLAGTKLVLRYGR